jgi:hypothetical protein
LDWPIRRPHEKNDIDLGVHRVARTMLRARRNKSMEKKKQFYLGYRVAVLKFQGLRIKPSG